MRRITFILALLASGCGAAPSEPPLDTTRAVAPAAPRLHRYRFVWSYASALDPSVPSVDGELDLAGELSVRVLPHEDGRIVVTIERLDRHTMRLLGEDLLTDPGELVGRELLVDGEAGLVELPAATPPLARHLLVRLAAHLDLPEVLAGRDVMPGERVGDGAPERFELARTATELDAGRPAVLAAERVALRLDAPFDDDEAARIVAERFAGSLVIGDVELVVQAVAHGFVPRPGFAIEATGLLRAWPEQTEALGAAFANEADPRARTFVLDLLASAGTPQAESVMLQALDREEVRRDAAYPRYLQRTGFLPHPSAELAAFLLDEHDRASALHEHDTRRALLYAMGAVAGRADADVATALHERVVDELERAGDDALFVAALAGIGNAGAAEDVDRVLAAIDAGAVGVRMQAASSLRWMPRDEAAAGLLQLLDDPEAAVARQALAILDDYVSEDAADLAQAVAESRYHPALVGDLSRVLARRLDGDPLAAMGLVTLASRAAGADALASLRAATAA